MLDACTDTRQPPATAGVSADAAAAMHAAILGQIAEGVIVTDAAGRIVLVNEAAAAMHGVARLDVEPDAYADTYHLYTEDGRPYVPRELPLARAVRGEIVEDARWRILRPDGTAILAIGSARPLRGADGRQIGAVLTVRDDTAREAAERALRELNATLTERVDTRTREAEAAREQAEAASRAKSEFLAAMSHEIRTPLNGVLGYADLMLEEPCLDAAVRLHGERIRSAGSALLTIVDDILDFSRVEAGQVALLREPFAPADLVEEALAIVRASAARKGLALRAGAAPGLPGAVVGDRGRLRQVLLNLLNNAIKFTHEGGVRLTVVATPATPGLMRLRFAVEDTGIGVPATKRHLLFERFSQVDGTIQREFGGTGLGLAISQRLVELMGGRIGVDSEAGRGSTFAFEVTLPLAAAATSTAAAPVPTARGGARRLLLVEDVVLNQELACAVLRRAGHMVEVVSGGADAVMAVQAVAYDLVLMDVQMPVIDGITATRLIRALDHPSRDVPVVALTANVLPHQIALLKAAGMQDWVGKPFKRDVLLAAIDRWARPAAMPTAPETAEEIDRGAFDALTEMVGPEVVARMLAGLADELSRRLGADGQGADRESLTFDAHAMVSALAALGFAAMADQCRTLETACRSGEDFSAPLARLHELRRAALARIDGLRAA